MRKIFLLLTILTSFAAAGQTPFPLYIPANPDSLKIPVNLNGAIRTVYAVDLVKYRAALTARDTAAALRLLISGNTSSIAANTSNISANTTAIGLKVDKSATITINGTSQTLGSNPTFTVSGGGTVSVNDSIAKGAKIADSTLIAQPLNPSQLTWAKVHQQRHFKLIDDNFINYQSKFEARELTEFTRARGLDPVLDSSNTLSISGLTMLKSSTAPVAPFTSVELTVQKMDSVGAFHRVLVGLIKDSVNYIMAQYDAFNSVAAILVNGNTVTSTPIVLDKNNLVLTLIVTGNGLSFWAKSNNVNYFLGNANCTFDLQADGVIQQYKYGLGAHSATASPIYITQLRGGASGGGGLINVRQVVNEDNSPYIFHNKLLLTADWEASTGTRDSMVVSSYNWSQVNSSVFTMDMDTYQIETVGRLYFRRATRGTSTIRLVGGQNTKLTWIASKRKWLLVYAPDWDFDNLDRPRDNDQYALLDYEAPFGQTVIQQSQLKKFGWDTVANNHLIYDVVPRFINGKWYVTGAETNGLLGNYWTKSNPILFSGTSLDTLTDPVKRFISPNFWECGTFGKIGNKWYINYFSFGDTKAITFNLNTFDSIGTLQLPFTPSTGTDAIPGYDWVVRQKNGLTEYLLVGFDTRNLYLAPNTAVAKQWQWSRGNFVVYKANEVASGYEFPNRIPAQIIFPVKNTNPTGGIGRTVNSSEIITNSSQTFYYTGFKTFPGYSGSLYKVRIGDLTFQPQSLNNTTLLDNSYYNGGFRYLNAGYSSGFQFYNGQVMMLAGAPGAANAIFSPKYAYKSDYNGNVALGGNVATGLNSFTGATVLIDGVNSKVGIATVAQNSTLHVNGSFATAYVAKTAAYTATISDYTIDCNGTFTVTLPTAVGITGRIYVIKNSGTGTITLAGTSAQTFDGATSPTIATQYGILRIQSNGTNWLVL